MIFIVTTCKNTAHAERIATMLLRLRLVGCAKWWPIRCAYIWKGKLVREREIILLLESTKKRFSRIEALIRRMHTDEVPCIVSWDAKRGSTAYLRWVRTSVG